MKKPAVAEAAGLLETRERAVEGRMKMEQAELDGGILKVTLQGSLDIAGAQKVDLPFSVIAGARDKVIVDMTGVDFIASIGVRTLVKAGRPIARRGGRMVILSPSEAVRKVLISTGIDEVMAFYDDVTTAVGSFD